MMIHSPPASRRTAPPREGTELVLLTAAFPFGIESEPFLEPEVEILTKRFSRVYVLPSHRAEGVRPLPGNVTLVEMDWLREPRRSTKVKALCSRLAVDVLLQTLRNRRNWQPYLAASRMYLDILARNIVKQHMLTQFVRQHRAERAIYYDYWFENTTLALALLRRSGLVSTAVARAHRFDVFDEAWAGRPVPFREFKARHIDVVYPISRFTDEYLQGRIPELAGKTRVLRLGVRRQPPSEVAPPDKPLLVSCSRLLPRKRVHLIPEVLAHLGGPLDWVHFGDGPERDRVRTAAERLPPQIRWQLRGQVANPEVLRFYETRHVNLLISLSESEGLPVSMMEALSFGIPIVATAVHGVPEIVTDTTGARLNVDASVPDVSRRVRDALRPGRFDRAGIRSFFLEHFEATRNYNQFADALLALQGSRM